MMDCNVKCTHTEPTQIIGDRHVLVSSTYRMLSAINSSISLFCLWCIIHLDLFVRRLQKQLLCESCSGINI
jgi:hypothetical protein